MFIRNYPTCKKEIIYKAIRKYKQACKKETNCKSCCKIGDKNPMFGLTGEMSPRYGKKGLAGDLNPSKRKDVRNKISLSKKGKPSPMLNKKHKAETIEKIRESNIGQKRTEETISKIKIARRLQIGEKCPGWKGGITKEVTKLRNSNEYQIWRKSVFERDEYKCKVCSEGGHLEAHHIIGVHQRLDLIFDIQNGITLCIICHIDFHKKFGRKNFPLITEQYKIKI